MLKKIGFAVAVLLTAIQCTHTGPMSEEDKDNVVTIATSFGCTCDRAGEYCLIYTEGYEGAVPIGLEDLRDGCDGQQDCFGRPITQLCYPISGEGSQQDSSVNQDGSSTDQPDQGQEGEQPRDPDEPPQEEMFSKCHKAPSNLQKFCHSSTECKFDTVKFQRAEDGINLSGCVTTAKGAAKLVKGNACAGYSDQEVNEKTQVVTESVGAGKFTCGVYQGQLQGGEWTYSFVNIFGDVKDEKNTCFELIKAKMPEYSANFCKNVDPADAKASFGYLGFKRMAFALMSLILSAAYI